MFVKGNNQIITNPRAILLIQLGDIGDVVYSFPCVRALKETYPDAKIVVAVREKASGLIDCCPWADDVISVDTQKRNLLKEILYQKDFWKAVRNFHFDLVIDLRTGTRGALLALLSGARQRIGRYAFDGKLWRNRVFTNLVFPKGREKQDIAENYLDTLEAYGITTNNLTPEIQVPPERLAEVDNLLQQENVPREKAIIAVQPFSLWSYKEWAESKNIEVIKHIVKRFPAAVIVVGAPDERERAAEIVRSCGDNVFNFAGKTPLSLLPALFKKCKLFFGVDSAGVHIAGAVGTPTVSLYGPSSPETWAPKGEKHVVIRKDFDCVPCQKTGCDGSMVSRCMDELRIDEVLPVLEKRIEKFLS